MTQARLLEMPNGEKLMPRDPHPIVGWARFLEYQRILGGGLSNNDRQRLREAINKAAFIYVTGDRSYDTRSWTSGRSGLRNPEIGEVAAR